MIVDQTVMPDTDDKKGSILGLDVGQRRIGVAIASIEARLPRPLETIDTTVAEPFKRIDKLIAENDARALVIGLPRGLDGQETGQTKEVIGFITRLEKKTTLPVFTTDEALSSQNAEAQLKQIKPNYAKADIDAQAAVLILDDWLNSGGKL